MLVTIPSTAATLKSILTAPQLALAGSATPSASHRQSGLTNVLISNTGANAVYLEVGTGAVAAAATGTPIAAGEKFAFQVDDLAKVSVFAASPTDVRLFVA